MAGIGADSSEKDLADVIELQRKSIPWRRKIPLLDAPAIRVGGLRFGRHGISGIVSTVLLAVCLLYYHRFPGVSSPPPSWLIASSVLSTSVVATSSYALLPQVPVSTRISSRVIPPHREAFRRTAGVVGYLNLRLAHGRGWVCPPKCWWQWLQQWLLMEGGAFSASVGGDREVTASLDVSGGGFYDIAFAFGLMAFHSYHFFPLHADFANLNTWIFVLPIWMGLGVDMAAQFPSIRAVTGLWKRPEMATSAWIDSLSWDAATRWNTAVIDEAYLLLTMLCTMLVAFLFTLAFRGYFIGIKACYWISAAVVASLAARVFVSLLMLDKP